MDLNDVIIDLGGIERILTAIADPATDDELQKHLEKNCIGTNVPTLAQVKAHIPVYKLRLDNTVSPIRQAEIDQARADLEDLDRASLREVIEYIASKADAPATLKARNLAALVLVEKIK